MGCKNHPIDSRYCSEINSVSACFDSADSIDTYFKKNIKKLFLIKFFILNIDYTNLQTY